MDIGKQHKYICTNQGQSGRFSPYFQSGQADIDLILQKPKTNSQGPFVDFPGPCPVQPISSHTWGDCYNNPKNKTLEGQHCNNNNNNPNKDSHYRQGKYSFLRGQGHGCGCGTYNAPHLPNPFPTLYIQQAPTNVPPDALSTATNTDTSSIPHTQTYVVKPMNNNRGEKNSHRLYNNVVHCKAVYIDNIYCCETAADVKKIANLALPCANSHTHHFNLHLYPQDGVINGHQPNKNLTFYVFDTECIQEVDNFQIYIDTFTNETKH